MREESLPANGTVDLGVENPIFLPSYENCYVCGQNHPRGLRIRFFTGDDKRVHALFRPNREQMGYDDVVHGGVISALLDELIGWSVSLNHGLMAYTAELTVRFVKPAHADVMYRASSTLGAGRGKLWEADGSIVGEDGQVYAKGHGKYLLLSAEQTAEVSSKMSYLPGDHPVFRK